MTRPPPLLYPPNKLRGFRSNIFDKETEKFIDNETDESYMRYDKMNFLLLKMEADKRGIEIADLPDEFCDPFDALGKDRNRLLRTLDENIYD